MEETESEIRPEQTWESAFEQLRQEMPKAAFDTWVASAWLIGWENGCFKVGVRNSYARDWLEDRLSSTLRRKLSALMGAEQDVVFVVWDEPAPSAASAETAEESLEVEGVSDETLYQELVQPDRVITLPGYFRRWVGVLGPELAWMYVAFRQAAYYAERGRRHGTSQVHFSGKQVAALCGITERTFWNRSVKAETWERLGGLVERIGEGPVWRRQENGHPAQASHRYRVWLSLPLTPMDAARLARWLEEFLAGGTPKTLLERAKTLTLNELEDFEERDFGRPMSVRQVVQAVTGKRMSRDEIEVLVGILQERLMPSGDILMITHFFLEQVLPRLGAGPAWLYVLLRDRCWEGDTPRDVVRIEGGYAELARWLGLSRPLTVYEWLNTKPSMLWAYVREIQERRWGEGRWDMPRYFQVLLSDVPLEYLHLKDEETVQAYFGQKHFALGVRHFEAESLRDFHSFSTQLSEFWYAIFIPLVRNFHTLSTRFSEVEYATFIPLVRDFHTFSTQLSELKLLSSGLSSKALVKDQPPFNSPPQTQASSPENEANRLVGVHFGREILDRLGVNPEVQRRMAENGIEPWMVISWLLYAAGRKTIQDPVAFAISRTLKRRQGAGGEPDVLAQNPMRLAVRLGEMDLPAGLKQVLLGDEPPPVGTVPDNARDLRPMAKKEWPR